MKKFYALLGLAVLVSCQQHSYTLTVQTPGLKDGTALYLEKSNDMSAPPVCIDTLTVKGGQVEVEGEAQEPALAFLSIKDNTTKCPFILEAGHLQARIDKDSLFKSKVTGTDNNTTFAEYFAENIKTQRKMIRFQQEHMAEIMQAQQSRDMQAMMKLIQMMEPLQKQMQQFSQGFVKKHPESFTSLIVLENLFMGQQIAKKEAEALYKGLSEEVKATQRAKAFQKVLTPPPAPKAAPAPQKEAAAPKTAPNFEAPTPEGKKMSLYEVKAPLILLDFWASWCGPCRKESPEVVKLYAEFKDKGLAIVGFSLDEAADAWKKAIAKDQLNWIQLSNLKGWEDPVAKLYGVDQIPTNFLLDAQHNIIAKDLHGAALREKIESVLK